MDEGLTLRELAERLGVTTRTIGRHIHNARLRVGRTPQAARAVHEGTVLIRNVPVAFRRVPGLRNNEYRFWLSEPHAPAEEGPDLLLRDNLARLDALQAGMAALEETLTAMKDTLAALSADVKGLRERLDRLEARLPVPEAPDTPDAPGARDATESHAR